MKNFLVRMRVFETKLVSFIFTRCVFYSIFAYYYIMDYNNRYSATLRDITSLRIYFERKYK